MSLQTPPRMLQTLLDLKKCSVVRNLYSRATQKQRLLCLYRALQWTLYCHCSQYHSCITPSSRLCALYFIGRQLSPVYASPRHYHFLPSQLLALYYTTVLFFAFFLTHFYFSTFSLLSHIQSLWCVIEKLNARNTRL